jgi:hypothetical protein
MTEKYAQTIVKFKFNASAVICARSYEGILEPEGKRREAKIVIL